MANMSVTYQGPNGCLPVLTSELTATYGKPARTYEYVTGYKSAANVSGHNADANGRVHSVDIFVGLGNLTEAQGVWVAEQLRAEGKRGSIPGHPDRLAYIIHRGRIAGDHTGWEWVAYTGTDWHGDHIHVSSVYDYYWGDVVAGNPADYNSTAPWALGGTTPQSGNITPISIDKPKEDTLSAAAEKNILEALANTEQGLRDNIRDHFLDGSTAGGVWRPGATKLLIENQRRINTANAKLAALENVVGQLAKNQGVAIDYNKINASIQKALADGIEITGEITVGGTK